MTPDKFIEKWKASELKERSAAQSHFIDLCALLDEAAPTDADPKGEWYCFERGASKTTGGEGWADVWKRHHFGWEYKGTPPDRRGTRSRRSLRLIDPPPGWHRPTRRKYQSGLLWRAHASVVSTC